MYFTLGINLKTRQLNIKRAKPDSISWEELDVTDLWFSGWCELLNQEPPIVPIVTPLGAWASETYTGEQLFELWKLKMLEDTKVQVTKLQNFVEHLETFEYLQKVPEDFM